MLSMETELHLTLTLAAGGAGVNDLAAWCFDVRNEIGPQVLAEIFWRLQEGHWTRVLKGKADLICERCGVVHCGKKARVVRRGTRRRQLRTSCGRVHFRLLQVTCQECRATWSPYPALLELAPRQRVSEELERKLCDWVTELSYAKTSRLGAEFLGDTLSPRSLHRTVQRKGAPLEFTEAEPFDVLIADSTCIPAGEVDRGEEACVALQVQKRAERHGRSRYTKRVVGLGIGWGCWQEALATATAPNLVITDGESGVHQVVEEYFPQARHQQCEWHVPHSINQSLMMDGMRVERRREVRAELRAIFQRGGASARQGYAAFTDRLRNYPRTFKLLTNAGEYVLYPEPSVLCTTSLGEREMREINRRTDVGVRWSMSGIKNLLKLRLAKRNNPDDYARVWRAPRPLTWTLAPQA